DLFKNNFDVCVHLAAGINVQESIDNPEKCFADNITGTFNVLEECRKTNAKFVFMSSALVYDTMKNKPISELHPTRAASPYMASKIAGENLAIS
ncbi:MAG: SDR family oxidoreductase, partial [Candidatus Aenigmarchaeota archaeon]|nr:SDR family oxidoreductase [Candidatus Aenigmarchaeota archaeon]